MVFFWVCLRIIVWFDWMFYLVEIYGICCKENLKREFLRDVGVRCDG